MLEDRRDYNFSDNDLMMYASNLAVKITRDISEFILRGVDAIAVTAFQAIGNAFEMLPQDGVYVAETTIAVDAKNALRKSMTDQIQLVSGYVGQEWGESSGQYKSLQIKNYHKFSDARFLMTARNVTVRANLYLVDLTAIGLTQAVIDALLADAQSFEDYLNEITEKKENRDIKAKERTDKGNELYGYAAKYSKIGKLIWENVDESKYNDYVIYPSSHGGLGKVLDLAYDVALRRASWTELQFAEGYQLEFRPHTTGSEWVTAYEGADAFADHDPGAGSWYYRCRGENAEGSGAWSDELEVILPT